MRCIIILSLICVLANAYPNEESYQAASLLGLPNEAVYIRSNIDTSFSCVGRNGYYSDVANDCQIYHVCLPKVTNSETVIHHFSFICPNSTIFSQKSLTCVSSSDYACVGEYGAEEVNYSRENESVDSKYVRKPFVSSFQPKAFFPKSVKTQQESVKVSYPTKKFTQPQEVEKFSAKQEVKKYAFQEKVKKSGFKQSQFNEEIKYP